MTEDGKFELDYYDGKPVEKVASLIEDLLFNYSEADKCLLMDALSLDAHLKVSFGDKKFQITITEV